MLEKIISLEAVSLIDFLGTNNQNIDKIATHFPKCKIISRGDELKIMGASKEIMHLNEFLNLLLEHYKRFNKLTPEDVENYLESDDYLSVPSADMNQTVVHGNKGLIIKPKSQNQVELVDSIRKNDLVFATGPAGTGKTYIAVAMAVSALKNKKVKKIIITRPAVEAGESLGFLPGDLTEKVDPYLRPIYDALEDMIPSEKLAFYKENNVIEIAPLAFMRGRTLNTAFVLLDEAQNTTVNQMKMFMTRLGPKSKMVITGDPGQIDLPRKVRSGLIDALDTLKGIDGIGFIKLEEIDVMRHKIVRKVISAYREKAKRELDEE